MSVKMLIVGLAKIVFFRFFPLIIMAVLCIDMLSLFEEEFPIDGTYVVLIFIAIVAYFLGEFIAKPIRKTFEEYIKETRDK